MKFLSLFVLFAICAVIVGAMTVGNNKSDTEEVSLNETESQGRPDASIETISEGPLLNTNNEPKANSTENWGTRTFNYIKRRVVLHAAPAQANSEIINIHSNQDQDQDSSKEKPSPVPLYKRILAYLRRYAAIISSMVAAVIVSGIVAFDRLTGAHKAPQKIKEVVCHAAGFVFIFVCNFAAICGLDKYFN